MPRVAKPKLAPASATEAHTTFFGIYSMVSSKGVTVWHAAQMDEGSESGKIYGHVDIVDSKGNPVTYSSRTNAQAFIEGFTLRDNQDFDEEEVG